MEDNRLWRKKMRHQFSITGWALVIYYGIMTLAVTMVYALDIVFQILANPTLFFRVGLENEMIENAMGNAWGYFLAIAIGAGIVLSWKGRRFCFRELWRTENGMDLGTFFRLLCVFVSGQLVFQLLVICLEFVLNQVGLSVMEAINSASFEVDTFGMFVYVGILAPISEEILFRGVLLRSLQPFGKKFAILASAFLFGIFHGNLVQSPFAFVIGLILGYTASEYSILWAMVLHMFNNLILSDVLSRLTGLLPGVVGDWISLAVILILGLLGIGFLLRNRKKIHAFHQREPIRKGLLFRFFTAPGIVVITVLMLANMIVSMMASVG